MWDWRRPQGHCGVPLCPLSDHSFWKPAAMWSSGTAIGEGRLPAATGVSLGEPQSNRMAGLARLATSSPWPEPPSLCSQIRLLQSSQQLLCWDTAMNANTSCSGLNFYFPHFVPWRKQIKYGILVFKGLRAACHSE